MLTFRPTAQDDLDDLHEIFSNWDVVEQLGSWPWPPDRRFTRSHVIGPFHEGTIVEVALFDGKIIGGWAVSSGDYGLFVKREYWGRGFGTQIGLYSLEKLFSSGTEKVTADIWETNMASRHMCDVLGFRETGRGPETHVGLGKPKQAITYEFDRSDWEKAKKRLGLA